MNELSVVNPAPKRKRYTKAFKHKVIAASLQPGASVARVALEHGLNANMLRKWIRVAQNGQRQSNFDPPGFVAVPMPGTALTPSVPSAKQNAETESIRMEIPYHHQSISISLPVSQMDRCLALLRELLQ
ncbi:MAG: hypothetical protein CMQ46_11665 [Gammaproteobacteria bacterium]|nr:hypothetical protein [Gammaproteobacteria bacterium]MBJ55904.1 hypothetical protein [Gammaproteobacteria bacterium]HBN15298.1 hypothetical protein [Pseudohongiella sp.]|tara:strand:- start:31 stop:417 length:387 start_codon:yes stop_codon:yes gene_type:complete